MLKMQNIILRHANTQLSLRLGFQRIRNNSSQASVSRNSPDSVNKALYLQYVEQVLRNKQGDLIRLQKVLNQRQAQLASSQYKCGIGAIIDMMEQIKLIEKKLKSAQVKMGVRDQEYMSLHRKFEQDCRQCKQEMQDALKNQLAEVMAQRRELRTKLSQFAQLQSYEKYLNQLHQALETKSQELAERESIMNQSQIQSRQAHVEYDTRKSESTNKKRIKIFNSKPHAMALGQSHNVDYNSKPLFSNETFARDKNLQVNESSAIMAEDSRQNTVDYTLGQRQVEGGSSVCERQQQTEKKSNNNTGNIIQDSSEQIIKTQCAVQASEQGIEGLQAKLSKQALMLKTVRKWFKFCLSSNKATVNKKKSLAVNLWKLNMCYDQGISTRAVQNIQILQNLWHRKQKTLIQAQMLPYKQLSLKRRKYAELMFQSQQKIFHRKRIHACLSSIIVNRTRKQRLVFYFYFCKLLRNCSSTLKPSRRVPDERNKTAKTLGTMTGISSHAESDLCSMSSSHILHEERINLPGKKSNSSLPDPNGKRQQQQAMAKQKSNQKLANSSVSGKENTSCTDRKKQEQAQRLKQFMTEKERTEKLLATQCVKLQGLIKMCLVLVSSTFRTTNFAMQQLVQQEHRSKLETLQSNMNSLQFKFQLIMTKCRLGLANNSNKISTLENFLEFACPQK